MEHEAHSRLYIVAAAGIDPGQLAQLLDAAAAATLLITSDGSTPLSAATARPLVEMVQGKGIAALIEADAQLARTLRADGVHLPWGKDIAARYAEAREILGARYIVGVDVGRSRHDAMSFAEAGADYIAFGIPSHVEDRDAAGARRRELVAWWSEIFEVPCVAFDVDTTSEAEVLAGVGADFVALRADGDLTPAVAEGLVRAINEAARGREALA